MSTPLYKYWAWDYEVHNVGSFPGQDNYKGHNTAREIYLAADVKARDSEVIRMLQRMRGYTYLDAEPPELRAHSERCYRMAAYILKLMEGEP